MPRPPESSIRRFMMQAIMWVILGGTIGLAALVDRHKSKVMDAPLGEVNTLDNGISLRLPRGWVYDKDLDPDSLVVAQDPQFPRIVEVQVIQPSLTALWNLATANRTVVVGSIVVGDGIGELRSRRFKSANEGDIFEYTASALMSHGRTLNIVLHIYGRLRSEDLKRERNLIERIAASVTLPADFKAGPSTQPETPAAQ